MAQAKATSPREYLEALPAERRAAVEEVRQLVLDNLPAGYRESVGYGMLTYEIPLERYPDTYNKQPLCYAAIAANKNGYALHLMGVYALPELEAKLRAAFQAAGKKLDAGKSCVRFKKVEDLPLDAIGELVGSLPVDRFIEVAEAARHR